LNRNRFSRYRISRKLMIWKASLKRSTPNAPKKAISAAA